MNRPCEMVPGCRVDPETGRHSGLEYPDGGPGSGETVEAEASRMVRDGERERDYGPPSVNFARIAELWSPIIGRGVTPHQVALCMAQVKVSRLVSTPGHRDSVVDLIGYAITYDRVTE